MQLSIDEIIGDIWLTFIYCSMIDVNNNNNLRRLKDVKAFFEEEKIQEFLFLFFFDHGILLPYFTFVRRIHIRSRRTIPRFAELFGIPENSEKSHVSRAMAVL